MDKETKEILDGLKPLFEKAENENLWFYSTYQHLWFSPKELRVQHEQGRYVWGAINWTLRSPFEKVEELKGKVEDAQKELLAYHERIIEQQCGVSEVKKWNLKNALNALISNLF